jgi:photosystem II stability/assembly factor-like uncharacterized protein
MMVTKLFVATRQGLILAKCREDSWQIAGRGLEEQPITSIAVTEHVILAGARQGVYRSVDQGQTWQQITAGLSIPYIRWLSFHPEEPALAFAGTEPAGIFVSKDSGETWRECLEVTALREQHSWFLPYSTGAGCVRGFAFHDARVYAAVEVGGVLVSNDRGETWHLAAGSSGDPGMHKDVPLVHPDVHSIGVHPDSADLVFAPTGGGFYRSVDGGAVWERIYPACYCRAVWVDPKDPNHISLGPADSVDRNGRVEQSRDGGRTWQLASSGLETPWPRHMVERFLQVGDELLAVLSNGELIAADFESHEWQRVLPEVKDVTAVALA